MFFSFFILSIIFKNVTFLLSLFFLFLSCVVFYFNFYRKDIIFNSLRGKDLSIVCHPVDFTSYDENRFRYIVQVDEISNVEFKKIPNFKMELYSPFEIGVETFQKFKVNVHTFEVRDIKRYFYLKSRNIYLSGSVRSYNEIEYLDDCCRFQSKIFFIRNRVVEYLTKPFDHRCSDLIKAIIFGDRNNLDKKVRNAFYKSGVSRLFAVSGFHFSLMTKILYNFLRFIRVKSKISRIICILFITFYSFIVGFHPSSIRASIMIVLYFISRILFLKSDSVNSLGVSLLIILLVNPNSSLDVGLFLSFVSSLSIILFSGKTSKFIMEKLKVPNNLPVLRYITLNISDSIVSSVSTFPIVCIYFKYLNSLFIFSNLFMSIQIYILFVMFLLFISRIYLFNFTFFNNVMNLISKSIFLSVEKISEIPLVNLGYPFINLCISSILILVSFSIFFDIINRNLFQLGIMSLILFLVGMISHQLVNKNSIRIFVDFSDVIISNCKESILLFKSKNLDRLFRYLNNNSYSINFGESKIESDLKIDKNKIYKIHLWGKILDLLIFQNNNNPWIQLKCFEKIILICMSGGDVRNFDDELKNCDILILFKIPNNFKLINFKTLVYVDNSDIAKNNYVKLPKNSIIPSGDNVEIDIGIDRLLVRRGF